MIINRRISCGGGGKRTATGGAALLERQRFEDEASEQETFDASLERRHVLAGPGDEPALAGATRRLAARLPIDERGGGAHRELLLGRQHKHVAHAAHDRLARLQEKVPLAAPQLLRAKLRAIAGRVARILHHAVLHFRHRYQRRARIDSLSHILPDRICHD
jgi:hypothetical protein